MVSSPVSTAAATQAFLALAEQWTQCHRERDIEKLLSFYTPDARVFAPFRPLAEGTVAIRQLWHDDFNAWRTRNLRVETTKTTVSGDIAFCEGTYTADITLPNGKSIRDHGKWLNGYRLVGTTWKILAQSWSSNQPVSALFGQ